MFLLVSEVGQRKSSMLKHKFYLHSFWNKENKKLEVELPDTNLIRKRLRPFVNFTLRWIALLQDMILQASVQHISILQLACFFSKEKNGML
jgi:hypothetical protein